MLGFIANMIGWTYLTIKDWPPGSKYHGDYWKFEDYEGMKAVPKILIQLDPMPVTGWHRNDSNIISFFHEWSGESGTPQTEWQISTWMVLSRLRRYYGHSEGTSSLAICLQIKTEFD